MILDASPQALIICYIHIKFTVVLTTKNYLSLKLIAIRGSKGMYYYYYGLPQTTAIE